MPDTHDAGSSGDTARLSDEEWASYSAALAECRTDPTEELRQQLAAATARAEEAQAYARSLTGAVQTAADFSDAMKRVRELPAPDLGGVAVANAAFIAAAADRIAAEAADAAQDGRSAMERDDAAPCTHRHDPNSSASPEGPLEPATAAQSCRSDEGITVGLVDAIIGILRVLAPRDLRPKNVQEALADLSADPDLRTVRAALAQRTGLDHVDGEADRG